MKISHFLSFCVVATGIAGCDSDYEANPIVIDPRDDIIVIDEHNPTNHPNTNVSEYSQNQVARLNGQEWVSSCINQKVIEFVFTATQRVTSIYSFDDISCTTPTSNNPVVIVEPYTIYGEIIESSGMRATQIEFQSAEGNDVIIYKDIFAVENNRLYFGQAAANAAGYPTSLNFEMPYYNEPKGGN